MPIRMRIGEVAREHGMTIKALAERAGVAYNTAHALFTGRATRIDLDTLDRVCAALQAEPGDLFVRHVAQEAGRREDEDEGSYGTDPERAAGTGDRQPAGPS